MGSLIRATNLWGYADLVRGLGGDPEPMLARFGIAAGVEEENDAFVPLAPFIRLLDTTADEFECPDFGLRMSRWQGLSVLGPVAVIARNSGTLQAAFESIARYFYVHSPALHLDLIRGDGSVRFDYRISELSLTELRQGYELSLANGMQIIRLLAGPDAAPTLASFFHARLGPAEAYAEALGCPVAFEQPWCGLDLPGAVADRVIDNADPETRRIAAVYLESQHPAGTTSLSARVAELVRRLLPTGHCSAEVVADELGMHRRTLQRQLGTEDATFQQILDEERRTLAARYLAEPMLQLGQIARLLGYSEQASLNRSVQRWFGATPRQYRARLQHLP